MTDAIAVYEEVGGRLGNALFRYMAFIMLHLRYGFSRATVAAATDGVRRRMYVKDDDFDLVCDGRFAPLTEFLRRGGGGGGMVVLSGYFQKDLYRDYSARIWEYMCAHLDDILQGTVPVYIGERLIRYDPISYCVRDLVMVRGTIPKYDIVIHIRLEDFINAGVVIHPECLNAVISCVLCDMVGDARVCFLVACGNMAFDGIEKKYVDFFLDKYPFICVENNDVMTDFHIMLGARILVCSLSSLSWCAAILSSCVELVYMPEHPVFCMPRRETVVYPVRRCGAAELAAFLAQ
jgi:hypothetical protein